jgi:hypothetical protein
MMRDGAPHSISVCTSRIHAHVLAESFIPAVFCLLIFFVTIRLVLGFLQCLDIYQIGPSMFLYMFIP